MTSLPTPELLREALRPPEIGDLVLVDSFGNQVFWRRVNSNIYGFQADPKYEVLSAEIKPDTVYPGKVPAPGGLFWLRSEERGVALVIDKFRTVDEIVEPDRLGAALEYVTCLFTDGSRWYVPVTGTRLFLSSSERKG